MEKLGKSQKMCSEISSVTNMVNYMAWISAIFLCVGIKIIPLLIVG